ncbi:TonB-dependent siderophore receptor [Achromobacter pestifer]|uniref:Metal-pseudopaline receptor CntO n=1 Tax=Achromobacter pestifer TaxID=1353889 RepID=A0A6S6Z081_9BURK|nr:TonB-dependent receptor [Achromobacter pestifer]CAB3653985.1 Metal-pseudopaline receptor CntO [Achromobacter pestifer]
MLACAMPAGVHAQGSVASPAQKAYLIPAGPLAQVLGRYADAAGISLSYAPALVQEKTSPGLSGAYSVADGFAQLLEGSGLMAVADGPEGYVLLPAVSPQSVSTDSATILQQVKVVGDPLRDGYAAATESLATGVPTPLQHIPQSVHVVTNQVIRDQQAQTLDDILRNIGGTSGNAQVYGFSTDAYELRGYTARVLLDGITPQNTFRVPAVGIERVDVLKGLDSAALGDVVHGGVVNVQLKQPQQAPVREATLQAGSYGHVGMALDLGDAIEDSHWQYRVIMSSEKADHNFGGYRDFRQRYLAPSLAWDDGRTRLLLGVQYVEGRLPVRPFTVWQEGRPAALNGPLGNADDHTDFHQVRPYYQFEHKLGTDWTFYSAASLTRQSSKIYAHDVGPADAAGDAFFQGYVSQYRQQDAVFDNNVKGRLGTGSVKHDVMFGFSRYTLDSDFSNVFLPGVQGNIFRPDLPLPSVAPGDDVFKSTDQSNSTRVYAQDFISIGKWHILGGVAYNRASVGAGPSTAWAPKGGVAYDVTPEISVYGNYARSFSVQPYVLQDGQTAPPLTGKTLEAGVKFAWPDKPLDFSIALFKVSQSQIAQGTADGIGYELVDGGDSRGVELNVQGQLAPGWQVIGSYTYTDYRPSAGQINQIPRHTASLWTTYSFQRPEWHGWGVGAGLYGRTSYTVDDLGLGHLVLPGQTRTDLSLFYRNAKFSATLGVKNVFDKQLYLGHALATRMFLEPGRTVMLTTTYAF